MVVIASMLIIALGEHTYLANAQIHIKKSTTSCVGDTCHTSCVSTVIATHHLLTPLPVAK